MNKWLPLLLLAVACAMNHPAEVNPASNDASDNKTLDVSQILQTPIRCAYIESAEDAMTTPYIPLGDLCVVSTTYFDNPAGIMNQRGWHSDWNPVPIPTQCLNNPTCECLAPLGICPQGLNCVDASVKTISCIDPCTEYKDYGWYFTCSCTTPAGESYCSSNNDGNPNLTCTEGGYEEEPTCTPTGVDAGH